MAIESQYRINELNECVRNHVVDVSTWLNSCELRLSSEFGCGVFASRDIKANEILFADRPLLLGPTGNKSEPIVCVVCYEKIGNNSVSHLSAKQCGLVLCGRSVCAEKHESECQYIQKWKPLNPHEFSFTKAKALFVIRSLFLNEEQKKFLNLMQKNYISLKNEIYFDGEFENFPQDNETLEGLRAASAAINTNAFKVLYSSSESEDISVRGFYPIMSLVNHNCLPNVRHDIDNKFVSRVFATRLIKKDEQIFMSYSQLLWGTNSRRMHMMMSKQFLCACDRCADPTENSTYLSAICCPENSCDGFVLPIEPINFKSNAKCNCCGKICERKRFVQTQEMSASMIRGFLSSHFTVSDLNNFIKARLRKILPDTSQFVVESKLKAVWKCETTNSEDLTTVKSYCEEILKILNNLGAGECSLKGFLVYKLYTIRKQLKNSLQPLHESQGDTEQVTISEFDRFLNDDEQLWKKAKTILMHVSAAPLDIIAKELADIELQNETQNCIQ